MKIRIFQRPFTEVNKLEYDIAQFIGRASVDFCMATTTTIGEGITQQIVTTIFYEED